jgi:hypothetical protein
VVTGSNPVAPTISISNFRKIIRASAVFKFAYRRNFGDLSCLASSLGQRVKSRGERAGGWEFKPQERIRFGKIERGAFMQRKYLDITNLVGLQDSVIGLGCFSTRRMWFLLTYNKTRISRKASRVKQMSGQSVERLMDIILQMRINLAHITETLHQQTFEIRQQLDAVFEEEKQALERCLSAIDQKLEECSTSVNEYQRLHAQLASMREKLVQLGADPSTLPPALPPENLADIINWRLHELKECGRL